MAIVTLRLTSVKEPLTSGPRPAVTVVPPPCQARLRRLSQNKFPHSPTLYVTATVGAYRR